jgi:hypothetical protein
MSDFNVQGRPIKRKRETSCNRAGPGNRDVAEMRKDANSHNQQLPKVRQSPTADKMGLTYRYSIS